MKLTAKQIFEKHIGTNQELGYIPIKNEDVMNAINEALRQKEVESKSEDLVNFLKWFVHNSDYGKIGEPIKAIVDDYIKFKNK